MAGQTGNEKCTVQNILVYKTDYKRSLIYLKGSVPGNVRGLVYIKDAVRKHDQWKTLLQFPTFVAEKGKSYPDVQDWEGCEDMNEKFQHDNDEVLGVSEEEEEGEPEKNADEDTAVAKK